jgi:uncharacterized protein YceK
MKNWILFFYVVTLIAGCGTVKTGSDDEKISPEEAARAASDFVSHWCQREQELPHETALLIGYLVTAAGVSTCEAAAPILSKKASLEIGDPHNPIKLTDLRPIAAFTQLRTLKLSYLGIEYVSTLYVLQRLPHLKDLDLSNNKLTNVRSLSRYAPKLVRLCLNENPLSDNTAENFPLFSPLETDTGWTELKTLEMVGARLPMIPSGLPQSIELLDVRNNAFADKAFTHLAPVPDRPPLLPLLKTVLLEKSFLSSVTSEQHAQYLAQAGTYLKEVHFKAF